MLFSPFLHAFVLFFVPVQTRLTPTFFFFWGLLDFRSPTKILLQNRPSFSRQEFYYFLGGPYPYSSNPPLPIRNASQEGALFGHPRSAWCSFPFFQTFFLAFVPWLLSFFPPLFSLYGFFFPANTPTAWPSDGDDPTGFQRFSPLPFYHNFSNPPFFSPRIRSFFGWEPCFLLFLHGAPLFFLELFPPREFVLTVPLYRSGMCLVRVFS